MPSLKPNAVLIVHGAYFLPPAWDAFSHSLSQRGFTVRCPRLPTCGDTRPPQALLADDVAAVRSAAEELMADDHTILVLSHSYGGIVASEAITPDLYINTKEKPKGVSHIVYLSAWLIQPGSTLSSVIEKYGLQCQVDLGNNNDGTVFAKNAPDSFYNDIEREKAECLARDNVTHNLAAAMGVMTHAPWKDIPCLYVHCAKDLAIRIGLQEGMVKDAMENGARLATTTIQAGHCPFLSRPEELIQIIESVVESN
ncbi:alpha/beta-hydrolase [Aspergillus steynii IBT 23096]|uniref:Alpha/beta-hydrolase n=1 Tax=Aspergillus steynii IBT 23096 TaxID=1392250 RepID=A0A2I2FVW9_9EURO|nr:alpha/beta-hydrolase [Aspergillus steynii IBT 23096]PLB44793.1 alpha/beta-hydrolase [Aspergillus steynii IBT 23096]